MAILPDQPIEEDQAERFADQIVWIECEVRDALDMEQAAPLGLTAPGRSK